MFIYNRTRSDLTVIFRDNINIVQVALVLRPTSFTPFSFNSPYQFTSLLNLHQILIFGVTLFGWNALYYANPYLYHYLLWEYYFLFTLTSSGT
jgi:hypothetical protein